MYKMIILAVAVCVVFTACTANVQQTSKKDEEPEETKLPEKAPQETVNAGNASAQKPSDGENADHEVFVVFDSEKSMDFSTLTVKDSDGEVILPLVSESSGEPLYGVFILKAGEYSFYLENYAEYKGIVKIDSMYDQILVPVEAADKVFGVNTLTGKGVNNVYEGIVSEDDIEDFKITREERAKSLREFYRITLQNGSKATDSDVNMPEVPHFTEDVTDNLKY